MPKFDPPSDPFGNEKTCRLCDAAMVYDSWMSEWYCPNENCPFPPEEETTPEESEE